MPSNFANENPTESPKKILYLDMDGVLADWDSGLAKLPPEYHGVAKERADFFALMEPMSGAREAVAQLREKFDLYVLSTCPWHNTAAASQKIGWIKQYFGGDGPENPFFKRVILSHHKELLRGDFLVDDRLTHGVTEFRGEHIHFGSDEFPDWPAVVKYLLARA